MKQRKPIIHGRDHAPGGADPIPLPDAAVLETTDGTIDVNPTSILSIGTGITLTNPAAGEAHLVASGGGIGNSGCKVHNSANITTTTGVNLRLTFDSEDWDSGGMHSTSSNPERITCITSGVYLVGANVYFAVNATGYRELGIFQHSLGGFIAIEYGSPTAVTVGTGMNISAVATMSAGDWLELDVKQTSGGNLDITYLQYYSPWFWAQRIA